MSKWYSIDNLSDSSLLLELSRQIISYAKLIHMPSPVDWTFMYTSCILTLGSCLRKDRFFTLTNSFILAWLMWMLICDIRGVFAIEIYWDMKNLLYNIPCLLLPMFAIVFAIPDRTFIFLRKWNWLFVIQILLCLFGVFGRENLHFALGAGYLLYAVFFFLIPNKKWKFVVLVLLILMLSAPEARSQVIKSMFSICLCLCVFIYRPIMKRPMQLIGLSFFPLAILLLYLGISGRWNLFDHRDHSRDDVTSYVNGQIVEKPVSMSSDTRTFLYVDVINSAISNDYVIAGRTPARGNDGNAFYAHMGVKDIEPGMRLERNKNEFCHPNVFTWTGMIGVILYTLIYLQACILGLFYSKNKYIMFLAVLTAFNWFFGWIENSNSYNMMNVAIWMVIGMCISSKFRDMSDSQFKLWFQSLFVSDKITPYHKYRLLNAVMAYKFIKKNSINHESSVD